MLRSASRRAIVALIGIAPLIAGGPVAAQGRGARDTVLVARRDSLEKALESIAVIDRKLMVAMRDGTRIPFDVYRPKNATRQSARRSSCARRTT